MSSISCGCFRPSVLSPMFYCDNHDPEKRGKPEAMKLTISPRLGENEEALNIIIKNFTEQVLQGTLEEKQKFLVDNGLASYEKDEKVDWDHAKPEERFEITSAYKKK